MFHTHYLLDRQESLSSQPSISVPLDIDSERIRPLSARKSKLTSDDDKLIIQLKEVEKLKWSSIARYFPGRSAGTLQVRYCTKLRKKTPATMTDHLVCIPSIKKR